MKLTRGLAAAFAFALVFSASAVVQLGEIKDGVNRDDPNFIKASVLVMSRGEMLFSCAGHVAFRMECPAFKLDKCFSYESENIADRIFSFFCGTLKMGLFCAPTEEFLDAYRQEGRGAVQYPMNLPPVVKQRLWRVLDERAAEGANLPYEYLKRGCCVQTAFNILREAIDPIPLDDSKATELPYASIREVFSAEVTPTHPWSMAMLHAICGSGVDRKLRKREKLVVPGDLVEFLRHSTVMGKPVITEKGEELLPVAKVFPRSFFSPMLVSWSLVVLSVLNFFWARPWGDWLFLAFQTAGGVFFTYLVCFSSLPGTTWNWLLVPFNPLPLAFWKWRRRWAFSAAAVLVLWIGSMLLSPQVLTDSAYVVVALAFVPVCLKQTAFVNLMKGHHR